MPDKLDNEKHAQTFSPKMPLALASALLNGYPPALQRATHSSVENEYFIYTNNLLPLHACVCTHTHTAQLSLPGSLQGLSNEAYKSFFFFLISPHCVLTLQAFNQARSFLNSKVWLLTFDPVHFESLGRDQVQNPKRGRAGSVDQDKGRGRSEPESV